MSDQHDAAASASAETAPSRRTLLGGGTAMAIGLPLMSFETPPAQGALLTPRFSPQLAVGSMPKIIIYTANGTFDPKARAALTTELTDFALDCEGLPKSPFMKSTVWTYFNTYPADAVFMGGAPAHAMTSHTGRRRSESDVQVRLSAAPGGHSSQPCVSSNQIGGLSERHDLAVSFTSTDHIASPGLTQNST